MTIWKRFVQQQTANWNTSILKVQADTETAVNSGKEIKRGRNLENCEMQMLTKS